MELNDHERIMLAKHYCERALDIIEKGPDRQGGWDQLLWGVNQSAQRVVDVTDMSDAD